MVQAGGDEEPFQKAVQEQPCVAGSRNEAGQRRDAALHRGPEKAGPIAEQHGKARRPHKGAARAGTQLGEHAPVLPLTGVVVDPAHGQPQHHAAQHAQVHGLDAQHGGLAGAVQAAETGRVRQEIMLDQAGVTGCETEQAAHQGDERGLLLFPLGQHRRDAHAEQQAEIVQQGHHAVVEHLPGLHQRGPGQRRDQLLQGFAGEQCPGHQKQAHHRRIAQRGQHRAGKLFQCIQDLFLHGVFPPILRRPRRTNALI